jgi:hypothetical protein
MVSGAPGADSPRRCGAGPDYRSPPAFNDDLRLPQRIYEEFPVEQLVPELCSVIEVSDSLTHRHTFAPQSPACADAQ